MSEAIADSGREFTAAACDAHQRHAPISALFSFRQIRCTHTHRERKRERENHSRSLSLFLVAVITEGPANYYMREQEGKREYVIVTDGRYLALAACCSLSPHRMRDIWISCILRNRAHEAQSVHRVLP